MITTWFMSSERNGLVPCEEHIPPLHLYRNFIFCLSKAPQGPTAWETVCAVVTPELHRSSCTSACLTDLSSSINVELLPLPSHQFCQTDKKFNYLWDIYASFCLDFSCPIMGGVWQKERMLKDTRGHLCFPKELGTTRRVVLVSVWTIHLSFLTHCLLNTEKNNSSSTLHSRYWRGWPGYQCFTLRVLGWVCLLSSFRTRLTPWWHL